MQVIARKIKYAGFFVVGMTLCCALVLSNGPVVAIVPYIAERINLTSGGIPANVGNIETAPSISQDGRYIAFSTNSSNLVPGDTNSKTDSFVRDRKLGTTFRISTSYLGGELSTGGGSPKMSGNGRFVSFISGATGVVPGTTNRKPQLYLRDLKNNNIEMVSLTSSNGIPNDGVAGDYDISANGRYIVFYSTSTNIVPGDTNGVADVFVRDRKLNTTTLLSKTPTGAVGNGWSSRPSISCDGSYVVFESQANDLAPNDVNGYQDIFLVDRVNNDTLTNITPNANASSGSSMSSSISCNGETLILTSDASNLVPNDTNSISDLFAFNIVDETFQRVNVDSAGNQAVLHGPWISNNSVDFSGRYVAFHSAASNLVSGDTNNASDIFLRDLEEGTTQIVSKRNDGNQTTIGRGSVYPSISLDGRSIVFGTFDDNIDLTNNSPADDVYVSKTGI